MNRIKHLIYGPPAAGILKFAIRDSNLENKEIIPINDDLSNGPLNSIESRLEFGLKIINAIAPFDSELKDYILSGIKSWPHFDDYSDCKIIIWHSENVSEQLMLQMIVNQLRDLELHEVALHDKKSFFRNTAMYSPEQIGAFIDTETLISSKRKKKLIEEWNRSSVPASVLRIWQNESVMTVDETYYDCEIINNCNNNFQSASRIAGTVLGESNQSISDTWINYRIIQLVNSGKLSAKGDRNQLETMYVSLRDQ